MNETSAVEKKKPTPKAQLKQAYKNVVELRKLLREIERSCAFQHNEALAAKHYSSCRKQTDIWISQIPSSSRAMVVSSLDKERAAATKAPSGFLVNQIKQAYKLVQLLPSWEGMPEGEAANQLRAIEALVKSSTQPHLAVESIKIMLGVKKLEAPKPKVAAPKPPKSIPFDPVPPPPKPKHPETGLILSPYHLTGVLAGHEGYQVPYHMIKKGAPITWGTMSMWMDKAHTKPGEPGSTFNIHPKYATLSHIAHHNQKQQEKIAKAKADIEKLTEEVFPGFKPDPDNPF